MKEAFEKIKERLEEKWNDTVVLADEDDYFLGRSSAFRDALSIVSEAEAEFGKDINVFGNGWITDRMPTEDECGDFRRNWFLTTVDANGLHTIPMQYEYTTVRGKEVSRWLAYGRVSPWNVIAWMPLPSPYKPTTD